MNNHENYKLSKNTIAFILLIVLLLVSSIFVLNFVNQVQKKEKFKQQYFTILNSSAFERLKGKLDHLDIIDSSTAKDLGSDLGIMYNDFDVSRVFLILSRSDYYVTIRSYNPANYEVRKTLIPDLRKGIEFIKQNNELSPDSLYDITQMENKMVWIFPVQSGWLVLEKYIH